MALIDVDKWREIFSTLGRHKLRTALTAFGVFWGIFMLTVLLGAGKGFENGVIDGFPRAWNTIFIWSQGSTQIPYEGMPIGRFVQFFPEDVEAIRKEVPSVGLVRGQNSVGIWGGSGSYVVRKSKSGTFGVSGGFAGVEDINSMRIVEGRSLNALDEQQRRKVALIGQRVRDQLFAPGEPVLGADITVSGIAFMVIGVYKSTQDGNQQQEEERLYLPNDTLRKTFNQPGIGSFVVIPKEGIDAKVAENDVKALLAKRKKVSPDDRGVFGSFNLQEQFEKVGGLLTGINVFSWVVAIGTIFAGAIGVGNIMLIVVKERTREIGLRKALGATPGSIVWMIMQESVFLTAVAGYFGLALGTLLTEGIAKLLNASGGGGRFFTNPQVDFSTALVALVVLVISGVLASLMPAAKAAAVNPIVALQDE
jgi:putative ABC transport system permease protein